MRIPRRCILFMYGLLFVSSQASAVPLYSLTDLGDLPGGVDVSYAMDVNNLGQVVGYSHGSDGWRAYLWSTATGLYELSTLPDRSNSYATAINEAGIVVGYSAGPTGPRAFLWEAGSGLHDLGELPGGEDRSVPLDINDHNQVVGYSGTNLGDRGFIWEPTSEMKSFDELPGGAGSRRADAINNLGQVVGRIESPGNQPSFLWDSTAGMQDLGTLVGEGEYTRAYDINNQGQVVGYIYYPGVGDQAFVWDPNSGVQKLGDLPGREDYTVAYAINESGRVVGFSGGSFAGSDRAFLWGQDFGMIDLNDVVDVSGEGWILRSARGINEAGQIVGYGSSPAGVDQAFLLTPIQAPEPSTWVLGIVAGLCMSGVAICRSLTREH